MTNFASLADGHPQIDEQRYRILINWEYTKYFKTEVLVFINVHNNIYIYNNSASERI